METIQILNIKEPLIATDDPVNKQTNVSINVDTDALDLTRFIPPTRASGSSRLLGALNDVSIDQLEEGQFLQYINEKWINRIEEYVNKYRENAQFLKLIFKNAYFLIKNTFCVVNLLTFLKIGDIFVFESERDT